MKNPNKQICTIMHMITKDQHRSLYEENSLENLIELNSLNKNKEIFESFLSHNHSKAT